MENIKQQIEELRKQLKESYKENRKQIWKLEEVLQQQVNKPKIEVGKVYKLIEDDNVIVMKTGFNKGYGIEIRTDNTYVGCNIADCWTFDTKPELWTEATKEEWETALGKHADKLYEGVEKVDRSGMNLEFSMGDVVELLRLGTTSAFINESGEFEYNGYIVMNSKGVWAKPCVSLKKMTIADIEKELGYKFELVKVG